MNKDIFHLNEPHTVLSLLPYSEQAQLVNKHQKIEDLYFLKAVVDFSISALQLFIEGRLNAFDAQVGENLCQIRACYILYLAKKWLNSTATRQEFIKEIDLFSQYKQQLEEIIFTWENAIKHSSSYDKNLDSRENFTTFFKRHELIFDLSDDFIFIIIISCFLTHFNIRDNHLPVAINLDYISREFHISKYRAKRIKHKYQQLICTLGCEFILKCAQTSKEPLTYIPLLPSLYQISDDDRPVLPCYLVSDVIFKYCLQNEIPLLITIHRFTNLEHRKPHDILYFLGINNKENTQWTIMSILANETRQCMVISGEVVYSNENPPESPESYAERFFQANLFNVLLANTASHPQYSGPKLSEFRDNPFLCIKKDEHNSLVMNEEYNFKVIQESAHQLGCSKNNPILFFLKHIYANTVQNEIHYLKKHYPLSIIEAPLI